MPENAVVSLELKNLQEVLAVLREMRDIKRELEEGGNRMPSGGATVSSGTPSTGELSVPSASTAVTSLSSAASGQIAVPSPSGEQKTVQAPSLPSVPGVPSVVSTTPAEGGAVEPNVAKPSQPAPSPHAQGVPVAPALPTPIAQPSSHPSSSPAPTPVPTKDLGLKELVEGLGAFEVYQRATALANVATGELGMSIAQGRPFRSASLAPEFGATAITALGAGLGFVYGGGYPGALLGSAIAAPFAGMYEGFAKPIADKDELYQEFSETAKAYGWRNPPELAMPIMQAYEDLWNKGYAISPEHDRRRQDTTGFWFNLMKEIGAGDFHGQLDPADQSFMGRQMKWFYGTLGPDASDEDAKLRADWLERTVPLMFSASAILRNHGHFLGRSEQALYQQTISGDMTAEGLEAVSSNIYEDPLGAIAAVKDIKPGNPLYPRARELMHKAVQTIPEKILDEGELGTAQAYAGLGAVGLSVAQRHGSREAAEAGSSLAKATRRVAMATEVIAGHEMEKGNVSKAEDLFIQAKGLRLQAEDYEKLPGLYARRQEREATGALVEARATQAFETSLYSGMSASSLPWGERSDALTQEIKLLRESMEDARKNGELSPALKTQFTMQIEQREHELRVLLPREQREMEWQEKYLQSDEEVAKLRASRMPGLLRASAETFAQGTYDLEIESTRKKIDLLEKELAVRKDLTKEERLSKEAQVDTLRAQESSLQMAKEMAVISARATTSYARTADTRALTQVELLRSAGGEQGLTGRMNLLVAAGDDLRTAEKNIADLRAAHKSEDSPEMMEARARRNEALTTKEQTRSELIGTPYSAKARVEDIKLQTQGELMQMGYGSYGDVRINLRSQINNKLAELHELDQTKDAISKRFGWTDEDEVQYQQRRSGLAMETAQLAKQYNEGWDQRLISEAFNSPGNGRLAMSQFTKYEAALAGVVNRSFIGTEETSRYFREETPRLLGMYGSGNPEEFANHIFDMEKFYPNRQAARDREKGLGNPDAKKQAELRMSEIQASGNSGQTIRVDAPAVYTTVEVYIDGQRVPDGSKRVRITDNQSQMHNFRGSQDVSENVHARQSPTG